ncbi:MAG: class I SAM-dependent methyltransferase [Flavobacteriales bacterium]
MNYVGNELELFQHAVNWKRYWSSRLSPFVQGRSLEVGCGLGVNAAYLANERVTAYTFLEPDPRLLQQVDEHAALPPAIHQRKVLGTTAQVHDERFETVLYIDVLEHIEEDTEELRRACDLLVTGGHILVLVPAFPFLYSAFDKAIGHHRRYTKSMLRARMPDSLQPVRMHYLDSLGLVLSLGNKLLLRRAEPSRAQITFWDQRVVPLARFADRAFGHSFGRSLVAVYRKA